MVDDQLLFFTFSSVSICGCTRQPDHRTRFLSFESTRSKVKPTTCVLNRIRLPLLVNVYLRINQKNTSIPRAHLDLFSKFGGSGTVLFLLKRPLFVERANRIRLVHRLYAVGVRFRYRIFAFFFAGGTFPVYEKHGSSAFAERAHSLLLGNRQQGGGGLFGSTSSGRFSRAANDDDFATSPLPHLVVLRTIVFCLKNKIRPAGEGDTNRPEPALADRRPFAVRFSYRRRVYVRCVYTSAISSLVCNARGPSNGGHTRPQDVCAVRRYAGRYQTAAARTKYICTIRRVRAREIHVRRTTSAGTR